MFHDTNLDLLVDVACKIALWFSSESFGKIQDLWQVFIPWENMKHEHKDYRT